MPTIAPPNMLNILISAGVSNLGPSVQTMVPPSTTFPSTQPELAKIAPLNLLQNGSVMSIWITSLS